MNPNVAIIVSARMASSRLPGKAMMTLAGVPMIQFLIERLVGSTLGGELVLATTTRDDDDILEKLGGEIGIKVFRGAENDVAGRCLSAAQALGAEWIVRVTGDCPFLNADTIDYCLRQTVWDDKLFWTTKGSFPRGIDLELLAVSKLETEWPKMTDDEKEHVTLRFYGMHDATMGRVARFKPPGNWPMTRATYMVDTKSDYESARELIRQLGSRDFSVFDLLTTEAR